jgi:hypothetical protein
VTRVAERKLLTAVCRAERVVDVEDRLLARLHGRAGLVDQRRREPRCLVLLGAFSRRLMVDCDASGAPSWATYAHHSRAVIAAE